MKPFDIVLLVGAAAAAIAAVVYWRKTAPERAVEAKLPTSPLLNGSTLVQGFGYISGNPTTSRQR